MLTRLHALSDEHFDTGPDKVAWGDLGTLEHHAQLLRRIPDATFKEGEHAD
jgi:hypothetical protein